MINADPLKFKKSRIQKRILQLNHQYEQILVENQLRTPDPNFSIPDPHERI